MRSTRHPRSRATRREHLPFTSTGDSPGWKRAPVPGIRLVPYPRGGILRTRAPNGMLGPPHTPRHRGTQQQARERDNMTIEAALTQPANALPSAKTKSYVA